MKINKITEIITAKLEEVLKKDKNLLYEIVIANNKTDIEASIRIAINQCINNVLKNVLDGWVQEKVKNFIEKNISKISRDLVFNSIDSKKINDLLDPAIQKTIVEKIKKEINVHVSINKNKLKVK